MAYGLRLSGVGNKRGKESFTIEPTWWDIAKVYKLVKLNWVSTNETGSYTDDDADILLNQARILHEYFMPEIVKLIAFNVSCLEADKKSTDEFAALRVADYSEYVLQLKEKLQIIESALGVDADKFNKFHICVYEWDSGY